MDCCLEIPGYFTSQRQAEHLRRLRREFPFVYIHELTRTLMAAPFMHFRSAAATAKNHAHGTYALPPQGRPERLWEKDSPVRRKFLHDAEKLLIGEISIVLHLEPEQARDYIHKKLKEDA